MKKRKIALKNLAVLSLIISSFIACDKDFANIDSDIINNDNATHFDTDSRDFNVIAYTKALSPVQTNNLPVNLLGVYKDDIYGMTTASIVAEVASSIINPTFGENVVMDSVVLSIPYFSTATEVTEDGETIYELDSVFGGDPIKLSLFESNYFLRDFDPSGDINDSQNYYANMSTGIDFISASQLEAVPLNLEGDGENNVIEEFTPSNVQIRLLDEDGELSSRLIPGLRVKLDTTYWRTKIIDKEGQPELSNQNNFNDYFRGIYFKAEAIGMDGNLSVLNLAASTTNITIYYTRDSDVEGADPFQSTYTISFTGNRVNFISNEFDIQNGNETTGDELLRLKGGQGSIAEIKLFNGDDIDDDDTTDNLFETFKNEFVETDEDGNFVSSKKLINEANLVFYVNQELLENNGPDRLYIYDIENQTPLTDYFQDIANTVFPTFSRISHLGRLQRVDDDPSGNGIKYKIKITEHINNLLLRDSTNVKLGLAVSGNINLENNTLQYDILTGTDQEETVPVSSIISPRGTILYGNNTGDEEKKLYLEIFFTEPNN
ncbi:DUF4270 domain-containing protein [Psychroserpens sp. SPM9]|uniref:DUF4270 domain-containing protein n=1 Tax=Psychroserpens sp. SPM9 TaxID=2975598 RepID=UPI0021A8A15D|nr:DUF4270 domain-containing protein [Psychroserpens sp. SPM9]MDG5490478.1 DUF4270 domain-containing protein [Psychroserpens sp. SPM9]